MAIRTERHRINMVDMITQVRDVLPRVGVPDLDDMIPTATCQSMSICRESQVSQLILVCLEIEYLLAGCQVPADQATDTVTYDDFTAVWAKSHGYEEVTFGGFEGR